MPSTGWDYSVFWEESIKQIRHEISEQEFGMWFNRLGFLRSDEQTIQVSVPSNFYRDQVKQRYLQLIEHKLLELSGSHIAIVFEIINVSGTKPSTPTAIETTADPLSFQIEKSVVSKEMVASIENVLHPLLNHQHTFENFVIGDNNSFAYNAALAIGRNPGKTSYNPCLIYGGVGLGKTHLLQSIGNCVYQQSPEKKILYISMENFFNEFTMALRDQKMHVFKAKYRSVDVLLIDDIHFIQGKEGAQEELFYTFEALRQHQKQMVFSCDRPISELKDITDRIKSRLQQGINVDLQPPSLETRIAIIQKKCAMWSIVIPPESITIICENITTNVRDLEAAVTKLKAYAELVSKDISPEITKQQLKDFFYSSTQKNITVDLILRIVAQYFGLTHQDMKNKRRTRALAFPRQVAMYIARQITEYSTTEIGLEFGGRDHTTVMHACQRIADRMKSDGTLEPTIRDLIRSIKNDGGKG
jgi:chromosomal replication initiator protein